MGNKTLADLYRFTTKLIEEIEDKDKRMKKIDEYIDILESIIPYGVEQSKEVKKQ